MTSSSRGGAVSSDGVRSQLCNSVRPASVMWNRFCGPSAGSSSDATNPSRSSRCSVVYTCPTLSGHTSPVPASNSWRSWSPYLGPSCNRASMAWRTLMAGALGRKSGSAYPVSYRVCSRTSSGFGAAGGPLAGWSAAPAGDRLGDGCAPAPNRLDRLAFDVDPRQPLEPAREPPVAIAEQLHRGRHEQQPDDGRVDQHCKRQTEADELQDAQVGQHETAEHADHDRGRGGDESRRFREAGRNRLRVVTRPVVFLLDAAEEEHLVVHRQTEDDREEHHRHPRLDRSFLPDADRVLHPAPLEDRD